MPTPFSGTIIERVGPYRMQHRDPNFHTLVRSIVYQQLSGKAALTIFNRLIAAAKADPLTPESILKLRPARMRTLGLSQQKLAYIRGLARMTRDGQVRFDHVHTLEDAAIIEHFTQVKGVGVWTAQMFLIFALAPSGRAPHGRPGRAGCHQESLQSAGIALAGRDGEDRGSLAAVLFSGVLVSVAQPG